MNMFTNSKRTKKFILVLVLLILFNFCYPKNVNAWFEGEDIVAAPAKILWLIEKGIFTFLNNVFCDNSNKTKSSEIDIGGGYKATAFWVNFLPETIIRGKFILLDANIFKEIEGDSSKYYDYGINKLKDGKGALRNVIAGWYYALRNFAIVALLSVLVYVGIRMILSTVAQDKAKYKVMFKDWLVALCLVVLMHYIMIGILDLTSIIVDAIGTSSEESATQKQVYDLVYDITAILSDQGDKKHYKYDGMDLTDAYSSLLVLLGILIYTIIFAIKYLKREFTIIFLILLGPISCITYPIDKISDGKAQAFNKWFAEFLYQVIVQPFHLLLYIVLVGTAVDLARINVLYSLMCFAVMIPAEKFIKEMFGFKDKLGSPLSAAGAGAMGAMASKAMHALMSGGKKGSAGSADKVDKDTSSQLPPRTVNRDNLVSGNGGGDAEETNNRQIGNGNSDNTQTGDGSNPAIGAGDGSEPAVDAGEENNPTIDAGEEKNPAIDAGEGNDSEEGTPPTTSTDAEEQGDTPIGTQEGNNSESAIQLAKLAAGSEMTNWDKIRATHNMRAAKQYGTTSRKKRWVKRAGKGARFLARTGWNITKKGAKLTAVAGIGALGATAAIMTGNGKEALGIASGVLGYAGKTALDLGKDAWSGGKKMIKNTARGAVKDYKNAFRPDTGETKWYQLDSKEEKAFKQFMSDPNEMEKAQANYMATHNGEQLVTGEDLENEMKDRFELARYGFKDDQIDNAVGEYQELKESGISAENALNQTAYATELAQQYSQKDFRSKKSMEEARDTIAKKFENQGLNPQRAQQEAERYLGMAARIKGTEIALPNANRRPSTGAGAQSRSNGGQTTQTVDQTIELPLDREPLDVSNPLGVEQANTTEEQMKIINNLTVRLQSAGYSDDEIKGIAAECKNSQYGATHAIATYKTKVEILTDKGLQEQARTFIAESNDVEPKEVTISQIRVEITEAQNRARKEIAKTTGVSEVNVTKAQVNSMLEKKYEFFTDTKAQNQAREYVASSMNISPQQVSDKQLRTEMKNRYELVSVGANANDLDSIRTNDSRKYSNDNSRKYDGAKKTNKQRALEVAARFSSEQMRDKTEMDKEMERIAKNDLKGTSLERRKKLAKDIVNRAAGFKGIEAVYTENE